MKWIKEIKLIGIKDWFWFVIYLKGDEFNDKLRLSRYYPDINRCQQDRRRAHDIDAKLVNDAKLLSIEGMK